MRRARFDLTVEKATCLKGKVKAPASKSYTTRAIVIGGLNGKTRIINPLICDDTASALNAFRKLGVSISREKNKIEISGLHGSPALDGKSINVGESGTLLRLALAVLALGKGRCVVNGEGTLLRRSNRPIAVALKSLGVGIKGRDQEFRLPITIEGQGALPGGRVVVSGKMSSQTISSLLNVAPYAKEDTAIAIKDKLVSRPYIDITIDVLRTAGIDVKEPYPNEFFIKAGQKFKERIEFKIHGDYSSAAFLLAAACLVNSDITITDLVKDKQGDRDMLDILSKMGAKIKHIQDAVIIKGPFELKGIDINCRNTPDLVPILSVMGCFAKGETRILDIEHLAHKESNRITAPAAELKKLGADIKVLNNGLLIKESTLTAGCVSSMGDHRIAMAMTVAGLKTGNLVVKDAHCISKSYPGFLSDLRSLGAVIKVNY